MYCSDNFHTILPNNSREVSYIKFAYVTNESVETSIKNDIYHYTLPCEMV